MQLAAVSMEALGRNTQRLPDLETPHHYLMRSSINLRADGGYYILFRMEELEGKAFAGMGVCNGKDIKSAAINIRGAFNRQYKGKKSIGQIRKLLGGYRRPKTA